MAVFAVVIVTAPPFTPGAEARRGANQHTKPEIALGDVFRRTPDDFVSLGMGGVLIVTFGDQQIVPASDNDVTVFVRPDEDLRPYLVEAFVPASKPTLPRPLPDSLGGKWVLLGESNGTTESFSLRKARVKSAVAIRITDLSRRTRDLKRQPLTSPGVSVAGVAALKLNDKLPWDVNWLRKALDRLGG